MCTSTVRARHRYGGDGAPRVLRNTSASCCQGPCCGVPPVGSGAGVRIALAVLRRRGGAHVAPAFHTYTPEVAHSSVSLFLAHNHSLEVESVVGRALQRRRLSQSARPSARRRDVKHRSNLWARHRESAVVELVLERIVGGSCALRSLGKALASGTHSKPGVRPARAGLVRSSPFRGFSRGLFEGSLDEALVGQCCRQHPVQAVRNSWALQKFGPSRLRRRRHMYVIWNIHLPALLLLLQSLLCVCPILTHMLW